MAGAGYEYFAAKRALQNTGYSVFALGYNFTQHWGIEGLASFFHTNFKSFVQNPKSVSGTLVLIDGLYHFCAYHHIEPYVLAGIGMTGLSPNRNDAHNEGNINAGAGLQWFANSIVSLRVEARDLYTIVGGKNDVLLNFGIAFNTSLC
jgi:hypothetical protein